MKAYGAGLLSSFGELTYSIESSECQRVPFDPFVAARTKYPITSYQPLYFYTESFEDAKKKLIQFSYSLSRPFIIRYNPYTQTVETIDSKQKLLSFGRYIRSDYNLFLEALERWDQVEQ